MTATSSNTPSADDDATLRLVREFSGLVPAEDVVVYRKAAHGCETCVRAALTLREAGCIGVLAALAHRAPHVRCPHPR